MTHPIKPEGAERITMKHDGKGGIDIFIEDFLSVHVNYHDVHQDNAHRMLLAKSIMRYLDGKLTVLETALQSENERLRAEVVEKGDLTSRLKHVLAINITTTDPDRIVEIAQQTICTLTALQARVEALEAALRQIAEWPNDGDAGMGFTNRQMGQIVGDAPRSIAYEALKQADAQEACTHEEAENFVCLECGKDLHHGARS